MKKTRYTEEQIAFALKQAETAPASGKSAERWEFLRPHFTTGRKNLPGWA
ncbi:transposase subfamily protein [Salmonella enterica subsp. arizonae]|uniref:Transposase subfamily protein n=1 Tax=Salmonella enterica subsp. arizonae TaxID=59203 RepID=A0A379S9V3_SALER|nr:transposase subfamily protein [Salmonella enterica subsp. arizonae]